MKRRDFLVLGTTATAAATLLPHAFAAAAEAGATDELLRDLVRANDEGIPKLLARQERRTGHPSRGGLPNDYGIFTAGGTAGLVSSLCAAISARDSQYFNSSEIAEPLGLGIRFLLAAQHDDGTIDLPETNFHSPPDVAFVLALLCPALALLRRQTTPALAALAPELGKFVAKGADALAVGGVHTPNHRWVVCGALAWANVLFPDARYLRRIDQWLAEGIDLDADGQFTEKSTTVYSPIVDHALITVARLLDRPGLLEPVRRNLEMTLYYVHPDGEVVTEASRRQDRYTRGSMARYYYSYRYLALRDGNGRFAAMTRQIERTARANLGGELPAFLTEPELLRPLPADAPLPTDYAKVFANSNLVRIRRGAASGTVLAANSTAFSFRKKSAALEALRFASAFFGKGQFIADKLEVANGVYRLRQQLEGPYFQPLAAAQIVPGEPVRMAPNGTLATDGRVAREQSNVQHLESVVEVTENAGRFTLAIAITGTDGVPVAVELAFRHGGTLQGVEPAPGVKDGYLLRGATGRYVNGDDTIEFGPGRVDHTYTQLRGALPKWDGQSVYLTGMTPFHTTLTIA
jgi:hypothetical protein